MTVNLKKSFKLPVTIQESTSKEKFGFFGN